ncbi:UDP-glucosyltransferase 2-like [Bolinopsis microptera]|uniref:UDP-glucosyltransferase 2-like n=1 Tax=Bolinopsis microptera TaxID=2820187 RepID=UPI003079B994
MERLSSMLYVLLSTLVSISYSANILVTVGTYGSHLYVSAAVAEFLVESGHNVTVLSLYDDMNVDMSSRKFLWNPVTDREGSKKELESVNELIKQLVDLPSKDMMSDLLAGTELARKRSLDFFSYGFDYFTGENFEHLMRERNFDLVVMEDTAIGAAYFLATAGLPVLGLTCTSEIAFLRSKEGYSTLQFSEPNSLLGGEFPPTLRDRWDATMRLFSIIKLSGSMFYEQPKFTKYNMEELDRVADVRFVMDHPAVGFPYLLPPNTFSLGFFHLKTHQLNPLPDDLNNFIANCPHHNIVYLSFGSFFATTMLEVLAATNACLILKFTETIEDQFGFAKDQVLAKSWIPQKDLLGSGKISFFVSHCGNNGRLESIFYNVPLFCVPLFADQVHNAAIVKRNKFGVMLLKEDLTHESFKMAVDTMLKEKGVYSKIMREATEAVIDDPGSGEAVLKYHVDRLLKFGNADYLRNSEIKQQSIVEMYNLDILMFFLIIFLSIMVSILICIFKLVKCTCRKVFKSKQE